MVLVVRVKLIATLGPASSSIEVVEALVRAGASGFRINFSHGDTDEWSQLVKTVRSVEYTTSKALPIIMDLRGSSIRLGNFPESVRVEKGDNVIFSLKELSLEKKIIPLPNPQIYGSVEEGDILVMDDERLRLRVTSVGPERIECVSLCRGVIKPRKGVVVKGKELDLPTLTEKDVRDLAFACSVDADYIGLSYVRRASDIEILREQMDKHRCRAKVIAKIETASAVRNLGDIIEASDVILVARGDLGMNFGLEEIPRLQHIIVKESLRRGKPVIIATQLLESMISNPIPTRAEVVDVANAVEEGVDALMLTRETSVGRYPVEAIEWLRRIGERIEKWKPVEGIRQGGPLKRRYAKGVTELAEDLGAKLVIYSRHGNTARFISSIRPKTDFYVGVPSLQIARSLNILWGTEPVIIEADSYEEGLEKTFSHLKKNGTINYGDLVVLTYGMLGDEQVIKVRRNT